jgi:dihydropteroate synthase
MGVLNVTPDSFSDGGQFLDPERALEQASMLSAQGAQIIDVGGESTRPGAVRVTPAEEQARILPVIKAIKSELKLTISVDTINSSTARKSVKAGANIVNDISGGLSDPQMFAAIQDLDCKYVLGHWRGNPQTMESLAHYSDVAREVVAELAEQVAMAVAAGISRDRIIVDPGLGFAKDIYQNWDLVNRLDELERLGLPVLVGASRKRFLAHALSAEDPASVSMPRRDVATAVLTALLLQRKLWGVRVHDVQSTSDAIAIVSSLKNHQETK